MSKRITAKTDEYTNDQGETKGRYVNIGVILSNDNGEYVLLDPAVNLSGILQKQNMLAAKKLKAGGNAKIGTSVICSIFTDQPREQAPPAQQAAPPSSGGDYNDDIPFAQFERGTFA